MFGYITINQQELKLKDYDLYRSYYCGLCHTLKKRYGRKGQLLLNYDMTFLAILLSGLYEPLQEKRMSRCIVHPARRHHEILSEIQEYAADMTVLLSYEKALDDWKDDRSVPGKTLQMLLQKDAKKLRERWPRQSGTLHECVEQLAELEKAGCSDPDLTAGLTGKFLAEMFVMKEDEWQNDLRRTGFFMGKFIYLMDAWDDLEKDGKKNSYNIFLQMDAAGEDGSSRAMEMMNDTMAQCAAAFERLPIIENADILRNIMYSGVWMKAAAKLKRNEK